MNAAFGGRKFECLTFNNLGEYRGLEDVIGRVGMACHEQGSGRQAPPGRETNGRRCVKLSERSLARPPPSEALTTTPLPLTFYLCTISVKKKKKNLS